MNCNDIFVVLSYSTVECNVSIVEAEYSLSNMLCHNIIIYDLIKILMNATHLGMNDPLKVACIHAILIHNYRQARFMSWKRVNIHMLHSTQKLSPNSCELTVMRV